MQCSQSRLSHRHDHHEEHHNDDHDGDDHDGDDHDGDAWNTVDLSVGASVSALFSFFFLNLLSMDHGDDDGDGDGVDDGADGGEGSS